MAERSFWNSSACSCCWPRICWVRVSSSWACVRTCSCMATTFSRTPWRTGPRSFRRHCPCASRASWIPCIMLWGACDLMLSISRFWPRTVSRSLSMIPWRSFILWAPIFSPVSMSSRTSLMATCASWRWRCSTSRARVSMAVRSSLICEARSFSFRASNSRPCASTASRIFVKKAADSSRICVARCSSEDSSSSPAAGVTAPLGSSLLVELIGVLLGPSGSWPSATAFVACPASMFCLLFLRRTCKHWACLSRSPASCLRLPAPEFAPAPGPALPTLPTDHS
mmetsp:Transcript_77444/g.230709  ORF Transcript_77444/g.230709 Transcript_77444/m.230709 type:complete len:282 (-) Transcript_77444:150-995(-)